MIRFWGITLSLFLTACGGGGGGGDGAGSGIDPRLARIDVYETQRIRVVGDPDAGVMGMPQTDPAQIPVTGAVTYDGSVTILADTDPAITTLIGDAQVAMDFDSNAISGQMTAIFGMTDGSALRDYDGTLVIENGQTGPDHTWSINYAGTLSSAGDILDFDGAVSGEFLGSDAAAIAGAGFDDTVVVNGAEADMVITIIGERDTSSP